MVLIKLSNISQFYINTQSAKWVSCIMRHAPLMCMEIAQLCFPLLVQFFCRWKVPALIYLINYQMQTVDQSIFLTRAYYLIFSFLSRHAANGAWLFPKVGSYRFNDVELTQLSSLSSRFACVNAVGSSVQVPSFLSLSLLLSHTHINWCTQRSHYFRVVTLTAMTTGSYAHWTNN